MFKKIMLATDLTPITERATDYAAEIAQKFGGEVIVLYAIQPPAFLGKEASKQVDRMYAGQQEEAKERAEKVLSAFSDRGVKATLVTEVGKPWEVVLRLTREEQIDLVVTGSKAVREGEKVYLGSTSHNIFLMSPVPVLAVREDSPSS